MALALVAAACSGSDDDGPRIAFWSHNDGPYAAIYVATSDGDEVTRLTSGARYAWAPDGKTLAFENSADDLDSDIYTINKDGAGRKLLLRNGSEPIWSPDGRRIAFLRWVRDDSMDIHVFDLATRNETRLTSAGRIDDPPSWSPDGTMLTFSRRNYAPKDETSIYTIRVDGSGLRQLTHSGPRVWNEAPTWSPEGDQIIFHRLFVYGPDASVADEELYAIAPDGTAEHRFTHGPGNACCPAWTADGDKVAFTRWMSGPERSDIYVLNSDGSGARRLTDSGAESDAAWSPDGKNIAFLSTRDDMPDQISDQVYLMTADGSDQRRVSQTGTSDLSPLFSPG